MITFYSSVLSRCVSLASAISVCTLLVACGGSDSGNTSTQTHSQAAASLPVSEPEPIVEEPASQPVVERAPLTITLSWTAPFMRENGEALTMGDISGYEIVTESSALQQGAISVPTADITTHTFENLTPANYAFSIYTFDNENNRSQPSSPLTILESQFPVQ